MLLKIRYLQFNELSVFNMYLKLLLYNSLLSEVGYARPCTLKNQPLKTKQIHFYYLTNVISALNQAGPRLREMATSRQGITKTDSWKEVDEVQKKGYKGSMETHFLDRVNP